MISNFSAGFKAKKVYKTIYHFLFPVLVLATCLFLILSVFQSAQTPVYTVVFYDSDGETVLDIQYVAEDTEFELPNSPAAKGEAAFCGWIYENWGYLYDFDDPDAKRVMDNMSFVAQYEGVDSVLKDERVFEEQKPIETNSHTTIFVIFVCAVALCLAMFTIDKLFEKQDDYRLFGTALKKKFNMSSCVCLIALTIFTLTPFYVLVITSLKTSPEANAVGFTWWPQGGITFEHFKEIFDDGDRLGLSMLRAFGNSMLYAFVPTLIGLFVSAMAAYAFAKLEFKGKKFLYKFLLATMMVPGVISMASSFVIFDSIGWTSSQLAISLPLLIPGCFGSVGMTLFLKEYFMGIPDGLLEAAKIDGCGRWRTFWSIVIPLGRPALIAQFILAFISSYNNYMSALIYLTNPKQFTVQLALSFFNSHGADRALVAAAGVFGLAPMLLLYVIFQKQIINGISLSSGLKG